MELQTAMCAYLIFYKFYANFESDRHHQQFTDFSIKDFHLPQNKILIMNYSYVVAFPICNPWNLSGIQPVDVLMLFQHGSANLKFEYSN